MNNGRLSKRRVFRSARGVATPMRTNIYILIVIAKRGTGPVTVPVIAWSRLVDFTSHLHPHFTHMTL